MDTRKANKKNQKPLTKKELLKENESLRAEVDYLKKCGS